MPAFWVARSRIIDPVEYKKYTDRVPAIIAKYGGKVLARGGRFQIMEGPDKFHRFVVIEFATLEQGPPASNPRNMTRPRRSVARARAKSRPSSWKPATPRRSDALPARLGRPWCRPPRHQGQ
jgi:uncharacterized protein (DUF1330 family)